MNHRGSDVATLQMHVVEPAKTAPETPSVRRPRVLVVDSDEGFRAIVQDLLPQTDFEVSSAARGADALAAMEAREPDVLVIEKNLPDLAGAEVLREVRRRGLQLEAIIVTSDATLQSAIECMELGCFSYLLKPFEVPALEGKVNAAAERRRERRESERRLADLEAQAGHGRAPREEGEGEPEWQVAHFEKMAAMGQIAASVAHEINNPATYVLGNIERLCECEEMLQRLLEGYRGQGHGALRVSEVMEGVELLHNDLAESVADVRHGVKRIVDIARDLTRFSRMRERGVKSFDPDEVINSTLRIAHLEVKKKAKLSTELESLPQLHGNPGKLSQVLLNLVCNAAQAMPLGRAADHEVRVVTRNHGKQVVVIVEDDGPGIPEELREQIFEPFFTTKPEGEGTGLGLHICKRIIEEFGGTLEMHTEVGVGTRFTLTLPVPDLEKAVDDIDSMPGYARFSGPPSQRGRVLVVDDESRVLRTFKHTLGPRHELHTARDGLEALELLAQDSDFDLIICDLMMPKVSGPELYQRLAGINPDLPERFVFMTAGASDETRDFVEKSDIQVLYKPVNFTTVDALICGHASARRVTSHPKLARH